MEHHDALAKLTTWANIEAGAKIDAWWRVFCSGGDAAADPAFGVITIQFKQ